MSENISSAFSEITSEQRDALISHAESLVPKKPVVDYLKNEIRFSDGASFGSVSQDDIKSPDVMSYAAYLSIYCRLKMLNVISGKVIVVRATDTEHPIMESVTFDFDEFKQTLRDAKAGNNAIFYKNGVPIVHMTTSGGFMQSKSFAFYKDGKECESFGDGNSAALYIKWSPQISESYYPSG